MAETYTLTVAVPVGVTKGVLNGRSTVTFDVTADNGVYEYRFQGIPELATAVITLGAETKEEADAVMRRMLKFSCFNLAPHAE